MSGYQIFPSMEEMIAKQARQPLPEHPAPSTLADRMGAETIALLSKAKMRCGGCGSKVGQQVLTRALKIVQEYAGPLRPEVRAAIHTVHCISFNLCIMKMISNFNILLVGYLGR